MGKKPRASLSVEQGCLTEAPSHLPTVPSTAVPAPSEGARPPRWNRTKQGDRKLSDELVLTALRQARGIRTVAAQNLMVCPKTFYKYLAERKDDLADQIRAIDEEVGDYVESKLMARIDAEDTTAIIFYCRSKLKHRGYVYNEQPEHQQQLAAAPSGRDLVLALEEVLARREERNRMAVAGPTLELTAADKTE